MTWARTMKPMRRRTRFSGMAGVLLALLISPSAAPSQAQYHLLPGKAGAGGCFPTTPARICLGASGTAHCYAPPSTKDYIFGLEPKARNIGRFGGLELALFTAMFYGCGSGTLTDFSLLTVRSDEFVDLLPPVRLTNVSEYKIWNLPRLSALPILVTADFIWDFEAGETHFSHHRYTVDAHVFDPKSRQYLKRVHYDTERKYSGGDVDPIRTLEAEKTAILGKLGQSSRP